MKHNTHIYIAAKAIEFMRDSVDNLKTLSSDNAASKSKTKTKLRAVDLQRLLRPGRMGGFPPKPPQTRTSAIDAYGSSGDGFAMLLGGISPAQVVDSVVAAF